MSRISKVTTKTGDKGDTGLGDVSRVSKSHSLVWFLGEIDIKLDIYCILIL